MTKGITQVSAETTNPPTQSTSGSQSTTPPANQSTTQPTTPSTNNTTQSSGSKQSNFTPVNADDDFLRGFNSDYTDERPQFSTPITRASLWDDNQKKLSHKGIAETTADSARYKYITEYDPLFDDSSRDITVRALREKGITPIYDPFLEGFHADDKGNETVTTPEGRDPSPWDLIVNSFKYGYNDSARGQEAWKYMHGQENKLDKYNELLSSDEYNRFETDDWWEQMISGASQHLGQWIRQLTDPDTAALAIGSGSMALLGGQAGPQVLLPEEILTVPAAFTLGMKAGNAKTNMEIEGGRTYLKMLNNGVSEETARAIATGVGGVNAALETLQLDELLKAYKILDKVGADDKLTSIVFRELVKRGINVGTETGQEILQEAATIAGVQAGTKLDTGEWAYNLGEVGERLWDTAEESALTFGLTNIPSAVHNVTTLNHNRLVAAGEANIIAGKMPSKEQLRAMNMTEAEALGKMAVLQMGELDDAADRGSRISQTDRTKIDSWAYTPSDEQYLKYKEVYDNPRYYNQGTGAVIWPENNGFTGTQRTEILQPGTRIDRYGSDFGSFVSPEGTPYNMRAVAPGTNLKQYSVFEVVKPIPVTSGEILPWFDEVGGGIQYLLPETVDALLDAGIIRRIR